ncbi:MAG TPA: hypothetical protein VMV40_02170 [Acidiferrobacter sp.]|nr:hypothetical protein [Acidiferrobacter sp.]
MTYQQINLYHPIFRREQKLFSAVTMLRVWGVVLAVALLIVAFDAWQTRELAQALDNATQNQAAAQARLQSANSVFGVGRARTELATLEKRERVLRHLSRFLRESRRAQVGPAPVLLAVSASVMPGLWVTGFSLDRETQALVLTGHSERPALVPLFLHRLVSQSTLSGYRFQGLAVVRTKIHKRYRPYVDFTATTVPVDTKPVGTQTAGQGGKSDAYGH